MSEAQRASLTHSADPSERATIDVLGKRYRSLFVIGRGGMGTVEVALERGPSGFERVVALKRLLPDMAEDPRYKEMFLREARLASLLVHPGIVHAFDFGEADGQLYLAMEYVEGEPLSKLLVMARRRGVKLPAAFVAHVMAEVCDALHEAHELRDVAGNRLNLVHRDLSPHNVMISYEGSVKLLDFGVAKLQANDGLTRTGEVKGKMAYMSPEQAMGENIDRRSDIFSLGACFYEALAGERMWGQGTELEVMRKLALEDPPRIELARPDVPPAIAALLERMVARFPEDRPATAQDVASELRSFVAKSGASVDLETVRGVMKTFFSEDIDARRSKLAESLETAAPSRVTKLRNSIDQPPASARAHRTSRPPAKQARTRVLVAALAGLVLAGGVTGFLLSSMTRVPAAAGSDAGSLAATTSTHSPDAATQPPDAAPSSAASQLPLVASTDVTPVDGGRVPAYDARALSPVDAATPRDVSVPKPDVGPVPRVTDAGSGGTVIRNVDTGTVAPSPF